MRNLRLILFFTFILFYALAYSQLSTHETPISFDKKLKAELSQAVKYKTADATNITTYKAEDAINDSEKDRPWRFGENIFVSYSPENSGTWDVLPNGDKLWRLGISSPGALTINLTFDDYLLPEGAKLFIYNTDHSDVIGAFTSQNNQPDKVFATTLIRGDALVIEYYEPRNVTFHGELNLWRITHGYRNAFDYVNKSFGSSGSCNVNVACPQAAGWEDQVRSVCMLVSGGSGFCTGALINNTAQDGTPYILTANHCYSDPSSWVFWFNWQSATCTNPSVSPAYNSLSGATLKARNAASDFCLVQINTTPPSNYNVFYSGWNRTTDQDVSGTVYGIHHPNGDIKKISWANVGLTTTTYLQSTVPGDASHWRIVSWSDGTTTEPGSSGSPLFDPNHRIVGQLHGGYAACGNTSSDWYGKFGISWTGGGTDATRLNTWLDPVSNDPMTLDGYDPNIPVLAYDIKPYAISAPALFYCGTEDISPAITIKNNGLTTITTAKITYTIDGNNPVTYNWAGNLASGDTTSIIFPQITLDLGTHTFTVKTSLPNNLTDENPANDSIAKSYTVYETNTALPFVELFDATKFPPCGWTSYIGTNGIGTAQSWIRTMSNTYLGSPGSAFIQYENVTGGSAEDWLVTPQLQLGDSSKLSFYQCQSYANSYNTTYKIKVSTTSQSDQNSFTDVASYGESTFGTTYTNKLIDLSAYDHQNIYIAFVMIQDDGDNWYIDSVKVSCVNTNVPVANFSVNTNSFCQGTTVQFTDNSSNNPGSWNWTFEGGTPSSDTIQNPVVTYNTPGTYPVSLTATNNFGSGTVTKTNYITVYPNPEVDFNVTNEMPAGACNGSITANVTGGTSPFSYLWDYVTQKTFGPGATGTIVKNTATYFDLNISGLSQLDGTNLYITDICLSATYGNLTRLTSVSLISPDGTEVILLSGLTGVNLTNTCFSAYAADSINTGTAPYTGGFLPVGNLQNFYNGQNASGTWRLKTVSGNQNSATINNWNITFNITGVSQTLPDLCAGNYTLTVTDSHGCHVSDSATVGSSVPPLSVSVITTDATCFSQCNGSAALNVTGGTPPYTYLWSDSSTNLTISGLCAGTYSVTVTDANLLTDSTGFTITEPSELIVSETHQDLQCYNQPQGSIDITETGGSLPYSFSWSNGATTEDLTSLQAGMYSITVSDAHNCTTELTVTVTNGEEILINIDSSNPGCAGNCDGSAWTEIISGGVFPFSYLWNNGTDTQTNSNLCSGNYYLTVTDGIGCTAVDSILITEPDTLTAAFIITDAGSSTSSDGSIETIVSGGTLPYFYNWNNGDTTASISAVPSGTYHLTITDGNGCTKTDSAIVSYPDFVSSLAGQNFSIFPNPAGDYITIISNTNPDSGKTIQIYNMASELCFSSTYNTNNYTVNLQHFAPGIYHIRVISNDITTNKLLILK